MKKGSSNRVCKSSTILTTSSEFYSGYPGSVLAAKLLQTEKIKTLLTISGSGSFANHEF
jgi:hypothetical protein